MPLVCHVVYTVVYNIRRTEFRFGGCEVSDTGIVSTSTVSYGVPTGMSVPIVSFSLVRLVYRPKDFKKLRARMRVIDLLS